MPGGLVQLLTIGLQDAPLILNPEITFFKTIYRQHTNFSLEQIIKSIGTKKFNTFHQFKIPQVNDLLGGFHFIVDIPYFDIVKTVTNITEIYNTFDINELSLINNNIKTYLFFEATSAQYLLIPENFFNLSENDNNFYQISGKDVEKNLLSGLNLLSPNNYGAEVKMMQLYDSKLNQLLPAFRLNFNHWYEFWLKIFNNNKSFIYFTNIVSQFRIVNILNEKLETIIYDGYINYNIFNNFRTYLNFVDEIKNYYNSSNNLVYDVDFAINYAKKNNYSENTYKNNALQYNSLVYLFLLQSLYPDFSIKIKGFTFWKKLSTGLDNKVNNSVIIGNNNYFLEWKSKINLYNNSSFGNLETLQLEIYENFYKNYFGCEQNNISLMNSLNIIGPEKTWSILKTFYNQMTDDTTNILCFDDKFNPNLTNLGLNDCIKKYFDNVFSTLSNLSNLDSTTWTNFDDPAYLQPMDLSLVFPYLTYKLTDLIVNQQNFDDYHFFVLWRNKITIAYFFRLAENLDNYYSEKTSDNTFQNTFLEMNDYNQTYKNLTFFYNINLNRNIRLDNLRDDLNRLLNSQSFYGTINIKNSDLSSNYIFPAPSYTDVGTINYGIDNQDVEITDIDTFNYVLSGSVITINNWNRTTYNKLYLGFEGGFLELADFNFLNNKLIINLPKSVIIDTNLGFIQLKLVKQLKIPIVDFIPDIDSSGNINYPNISLNPSNYPDISFNQIQYQNLPYTTYNLFSTNNNIIKTKDIIIETDNIKIIKMGIFNDNLFYELKITNNDNSITRQIIRLDSDFNVVPNISLDIQKILNIDLIVYDFNLQLVKGGVVVFNFELELDPSFGVLGQLYWLIASKDRNFDVIPKNNFLPVKFDGTKFIVFGDPGFNQWDLMTISNSLVPNLYPILHHYRNVDLSGNYKNYQLNSSFYQEPFIMNTYHNYLVTNNNGHLIDESGNLIDLSGYIVDLSDNKILIDDLDNILDYIIDEAGQLFDLSGNFIIPDSSNNFHLYDPSGNLIPDSPTYFYDLGPGLYYKYEKNSEPLYYFYNLPTSDKTTNISINGYTINNICPINSSEFYYYQGSRYSVVYDSINLSKYYPKDFIITTFNSTFEQAFLQDSNFSYLVNLVENINQNYQDLYTNTINNLKNLGETINTVIGNSNIIGNLNLQNYNTYNFNSYSLITPDYYDLSSNFIQNGEGIQKFKISNKGYILTQLKQKYNSSKKISNDLTDYLFLVSNTLLNNISYISSNESLLDILNVNQYLQSYKPKYLLENIVNSNLYDISSYKITTLYDISGIVSNDTTEIYFNNELIDLSINRVITGKNLYEISEKKTINTKIYQNNFNDFKNDIFNYLGPVLFQNFNVAFYDTYEFINYYNDVFLMLDDNSIIRLNIAPKDDLKIYYNSYEFVISSPFGVNISDTIYVYQVKLTLLNQNQVITGNSALINFNFYQFEYFNGYYIFTGPNPISFDKKFIVFGNSTGNIDTFVPTSSVAISQYIIQTNFKSNIYFNTDNSQKLQFIKDNTFSLIESIVGSTRTYFSVVAPSRFQMYSVNNKIQIPPFKIINNNIQLVNDMKDFYLKNFNQAYYYKLNNNIIQGSNFNKINVNGNFNLWMYPNSRLKIVNTFKTVNITANNTMVFFPNTDNLTNYTYYYVNGYVYYIDKLTNNFQLNDLIINRETGARLFIIDDNNFNERDQLYLSIVGQTSTEKLVPRTDLSGNRSYSEEASIKSDYYYDYRRTNETISDNELDILITFQDSNSNNFMMPFSFISDLSNSIFPCQINFNNINYYNFLFYKPSDISGGVITGVLNTDGFASDISCNDSRMIIDSEFNFTLTDSDNFQKYKILFNSGQYYSYIWTLRIDENNNSYNNIFNLTQGLSPFNVFNFNYNLKFFETNSLYNLLGNNLAVYEFNSNIFFNNVSRNKTRQQKYYHSNVLLKNLIQKIELDYDPSYELMPELLDYGTNLLDNQNFIKIPDIDSNLKYVVLIGNGIILIRFVTSIDLVNQTAYLDKGIEAGLYYLYGCNRSIFYTANKINIYENFNRYYISSYNNFLLRTGDIILFNDNIFQVIGLNSFTMFYDLTPLSIGTLGSTYPGYYLLYRLNTTPKLPKFPGIVDLTINDISNYKFCIDFSDNLILNNSTENFSIKEGDNISLYVTGNKIYNVFNYNIKNRDYIIFNSTVYRIKNTKEKIIQLTTENNLIQIVDLNINNGFYDFYFPYQPCNQEIISFDSTGKLNNTWINTTYYEIDGKFTRNTSGNPNNFIYTRTFEIPDNYLYFENLINAPLNGILNDTVLQMMDDISQYNFYYKQPIKINSFISYIKYIDISGNIIIDRNLFGDASNVNVSIFFNKLNIKHLYSNHEIIKSSFYQPITNLGYYHYYGLSSDKKTITNYDISNNQTFFSGETFVDNVYNIDRPNSLINLVGSYHILLEKNKYNQYITHFCQLKLPNILNIFTNVEDYTSDFYLDKIHLIALNNDNTFGYKSSKLIFQTEYPSIPFNDLIIWKRYDLILNGLIENLNPGFRVGIDVSTITNLIGASNIYIDKEIPCNIILDLDGKYYLTSDQFFDNFKYLYTKEINYIVSSKKVDYSDLININSNYEKENNIESVKIPSNLTFITNTDYFYYSLSNDLNILKNTNNYQFTSGYVNLNLVSNYFDNELNKRVISCSEVISKLDSIFVNNIPNNIFDENNIYLDSDSSIRNIFTETNFKLQSLFNNIKPWNNWSLITNPDINKSVMTKGNFILDVSNNVVRDLSANYYTKSEATQITSFLTQIRPFYNDFLDLKNFESILYSNLPYYIKLEDFWRNPVAYINGLINDSGLNFVFDGKNLSLNGNSIDKLVLNNQYILTYNGTNFILTRDISKIRTEIYNFVNNSFNDTLYGVSINSVLINLINLSTNYLNIESTLQTFSGVCQNFADVILYINKGILYNNISDDYENLDNLRASLSVNNFSKLGLDNLKNTITYDSSFNNALIIGNYPYNSTVNIYNANIPYELNYSIDLQEGLYPYKISLVDETYADSTIYSINFLEGENLLSTFSVDYPTVYNNQIDFFAKKNFDKTHDFSIDCFKKYDISNYSFVGYVYTLDLSEPDLNVLDITNFNVIKYRDLTLSLFNNYLVFPNYIDVLTSFIQMELIVGVDTFDISNNTTYINLLKINQRLTGVSTSYTLYFQSNNQNYRVDDVINKRFRIRGVINQMINTKLILTIKPTLATNTNNLMFNVILQKPLTNFSYYFNLVNLVKNFQVNDEVRTLDINFIDDNQMNLLLSTTDVSSNYVINNIVHYAKVGEYPPEPIQNLNKQSYFLYTLNNPPYTKDGTSGFVVYDLSYNPTVANEYITYFLTNFPNVQYYQSTDIIKNNSSIDLLCNIFIPESDLTQHSFGGILNTWTVKQYTQIDRIMKFKPATDFTYDSTYSYYINQKLIDNTKIFFGTNDTYLINGYLEVPLNFDVSGNFTFQQITIQKEINFPKNNQLSEIKLIDPIDIKFDGYIQTLDTDGNEIGNYIYKININLEEDLSIDSTIYFNSNIIVEGKVLLPAPLYVITNDLLNNVQSIYIRETDTYYTNFTVTFIQSSYITFTLYKKISLGHYFVFISDNNLNFLDQYFLNQSNLNKFFLVSKFAQFKLEKGYENQVLAPSSELIATTTTQTSIVKTIEKPNFKDGLYKILFDNIEFYIGDQLVEQLNPDIYNFQYQFLKDHQKRLQFDKVVKPIFKSDKITLIIPAEFWFSGYPSLYLPMICINYTPMFLQFNITNLNNIINNGPLNSDNTTTYKIVNFPEINIDLNIDGILLDTNERELFGNNQHEYIIEIFKTYPDSLISNVNNTSRMKFKNLVKDIFFSTQILSTNKNTYFSSKIVNDKFSGDYLNKKSLYEQYLLLGYFNDIIKIEYSMDFDYIKIAQNEILTKSDRYNYFYSSAVLPKYNMEMILFLDSKYQNQNLSLYQRRTNLEIYITHNYKNEKIEKPISPIDYLNIQTSGTDLFRLIESSYFNLVVPYQKYQNSVDPGYYAYSFALNPIEKQPTGHINFSTLDDIVVNTVNNSLSTTDPFMLKTSVRQYQIIRIMSGMGALAWID